jgi:dTDP-4-dehydrorhamnose 3,5-epimerase
VSEKEGFVPIGLVSGVWVRSTPIFSDKRGNFTTVYEEKFFQDFGIRFTQSSLSYSNKNVFRGFHLQVNQWQLVTLVNGIVLDSFVDMDPNSATFKSIGSILLEQNSVNQILLAPSIAHGYEVKENDSTILYSHTNYYDPKKEVGVNYKSDIFGILDLQKKTDLVISEKDEELPFFDEAVVNFTELING